MATTNKPGPKVELRPFTEQEPFLQSGKKYYGYISGVGAGKTFAGILRTALNAEEWNRGEMGAIVAPTTTMIKDVIIPQMREVGLLDHWDYKSAHTDEPGIHTPHGGRILLLSADNRRTIERLAGLNLAYWWLDEASRVPPRAHEILTQRLRVGSYRNGYLTTTPMGRDYVYDEFVGDPEGERWRYDPECEHRHGDADVYEHPRGDRLALLRVPTWANPHTAEDYKEQMEAKEGQVYEREILGKFVDYEGLVYAWFDAEEHVIPFNPSEHDKPRDAVESNIRRVVYGVDWGRTHPFAIVVIGETTRDELVVLDEVYQTGLDYNEMVNVARSLQDEYGRGRWWCDPAEPAAIDMFQKAGLDAEGAENAILPGIQYVSAQRDRLRVLSHCQHVREEFQLYHYPDEGDDETPVDANNHLLDALRYALVSDEGGLTGTILGADPEYL